MHTLSELESARKHIDSLDFSQIINKMIYYEGWLKKEAETVCKMYKNFLFLRKKYSKLCLPPSEEIDLFWHNHILDTAKYRKDCHLIFGNFLDHYPFFGIDDKSNLSDLQHSFEQMIKLYKNEFGENIICVRGLYSHVRARVYTYLNKLVKKLSKQI